MEMPSIPPELHKLIRLSKSDLEFVQMKPKDLIPVIDYCNHLKSILETQPQAPISVDHSLPTNAQILFRNLPQPRAIFLAKSLNLISKKDNPDLSDLELREVWWLRASYHQKVSELISLVCKEYPTLLPQATI